MTNPKDRLNTLQPDATESDSKPLPTLTAVMMKAAYLLASGKPSGEVAEALGIHRATLHRWSSSPIFHAEQNRIREALNAELRDDLRNAVGDALATLRKLLADECSATRFKAATTLLAAGGLSLAHGPTCAKELVRNSAQRRSADYPNRNDQLLESVTGEVPLRTHVANLIEELHQAATSEDGAQTTVERLRQLTENKAKGNLNAMDAEQNLAKC